MLCILKTEAIPNHLDGYISRYLTEIRSGLYLGSMSSRSIDHLWATTLLNIETGDAVLVMPAKTELGFTLRDTPHRRWGTQDYDGIILPYTRSS